MALVRIRLIPAADLSDVKTLLIRSASEFKACDNTVTNTKEKVGIRAMLKKFLILCLVSLLCGCSAKRKNPTARGFNGTSKPSLNPAVSPLPNTDENAERDYASGASRISFHKSTNQSKSFYFILLISS